MSRRHGLLLGHINLLGLQLYVLLEDSGNFLHKYAHDSVFCFVYAQRTTEEVRHTLHRAELRWHVPYYPTFQNRGDRNHDQLQVRNSRGDISFTWSCGRRSRHCLQPTSFLAVAFHSRRILVCGRQCSTVSRLVSRTAEDILPKLQRWPRRDDFCDRIRLLGNAGNQHVSHEIHSRFTGRCAHIYCRSYGISA